MAGGKLLAARPHALPSESGEEFETRLDLEPAATAVPDSSGGCSSDEAGGEIESRTPNEGVGGHAEDLRDLDCKFRLRS